MADTSGQGGGNRGPGGMTMPTFSAIGEALRRGDIVFAAGVIAILAVLILPMPTWLLDFCLALSILLSVLILMTVMFIRKPMDFSAFPTVLLVAPIIRLAMNLASTRLILGEGHTARRSVASGKSMSVRGDLGGSWIVTTKTDKSQ